MFFNFKVCLTTCFYTLKDIQKWVTMNFHRTKKLLQIVSLISGHGTEKLLSIGFEILALGDLDD